jgi:hypothetical protein
MVTACSSTPVVTPEVENKSAEEIESDYVQELGASACFAFMTKDFQTAIQKFRILGEIVPNYKGYAEGIEEFGQEFDASLCFP